jgi:hypothetical protein
MFVSSNSPWVLPGAPLGIARLEGVSFPNESQKRAHIPCQT